MKLFQLFLLLIVAAFPLISCKAQTASAEGPQNAPTATALPPTGSWEISFGRVKYFPSRPGWRNIRIEIVLTNKKDGFSTATINTQGAKLRTTDDAEYNLTTLQTTGASQPVTAASIIFNSMIPKGYGMIGEFNGKDQVVSYCFQAEIPEKVEPRYVHLPNFNDAKIPVETQKNNFLSADKSINVQTAGTYVNIGTSARVTIATFNREPHWPITNDLITATMVISNLTNTKDATVNLLYMPITNDGIVGAAYTDTPDCKPNLVAPPSTIVTSTICALVPHGAVPPIHMIFWGDARMVYDTLLK